MSLFDDRMSSGPRSLLMHHNADEISVTLAGGEPVVMKGIVGYEESTEVPGDDASRRRLARDVTVCKVTGCTPQPISTTFPYGGLAHPELTATITIDEVEYAVASVMSHSATFIRLLLTQSAVMDKGRPGLRRK
jgi:hypothetical protein